MQALCSVPRAGPLAGCVLRVSERPWGDTAGRERRHDRRLRGWSGARVAHRRASELGGRPNRSGPPEPQGPRFLFFFRSVPNLLPPTRRSN